MLFLLDEILIIKGSSDSSVDRAIDFEAEGPGTPCQNKFR